MLVKSLNASHNLLRTVRAKRISADSSSTSTLQTSESYASGGGGSGGGADLASLMSLRRLNLSHNQIECFREARVLRSVVWCDWIYLAISCARCQARLAS